MSPSQFPMVSPASASHQITLRPRFALRISSRSLSCGWLIRASQNCQVRFNQVALDPRFTYVGNTPIGTSWTHPPNKSLPLTALVPHYDALLLAYGASKDRKLGIPGEDALAGIHSARAFVGWYNGLPEYRNLRLNLDLAEDVVLIGQGNVALDVARMLLTRVEDLRKTDITEYALEELERSRVKRVKIVGRRGPLQAAFKVRELRELLSLPGVGFTPVRPSSLLPSNPSSLPRAQKRAVLALKKGAKTPMESAEKSWELSFLRSPKVFVSSSATPQHIAAVEFEENLLQEPTSEPFSRVNGSGKMDTMPADLVFRSIGYASEPITGFGELGIPFDEARGFVMNEDGRVVKPSISPSGEGPAVPVPGVYASGWVKRGPTGVIASTMYDSFDTADMIVSDWASGESFMSFGAVEKHGWDAVKSEVANRGMRPISWAEWMKIDNAEQERGRKLGKGREKFTSQQEILSVLE